MKRSLNFVAQFLVSYPLIQPFCHFVRLYQPSDSSHPTSKSKSRWHQIDSWMIIRISVWYRENDWLNKNTVYFVRLRLNNSPIQPHFVEVENVEKQNSEHKHWPFEGKLWNKYVSRNSIRLLRKIPIRSPSSTKVVPFSCIPSHL